MIGQVVSFRLGALAAVLAVAVAGCGGGGSSMTIPVTSAAGAAGGTPTTTSRALSSVTFTIPRAGGTIVTSGKARLPLVLSPGGNAICVTVKNLDPATSGIYGSGYAGAAFTSCQAYNPAVGGTITVPAPPGNDSFSIGEYTIPNAATVLPFTSTSTTAFPAGALLLSGVAPPASNVPSIGVAGNNTVTITQAVVAGAAAQAVTVSSTANIVVGTRLNVDPSTATQEFVTVTAVGVGTITAIFSQAHANPTTVNGIVTLPAGTSVSINALLNPGAPNTPITLQGAPAAQLGFAVPLAGSTAPPAAAPAAVSAVREQGAFILAGRKVAIPIPLTAYDKANAPVPTVEAVRNGSLNAGTLPAGTSLTITRTENFGPANFPTATTSHSSLVVIDALTNTVIANPSGAGKVVLTAVNSLNQTDFPTIGVGQINDPMVLAVVYDGVSGEELKSITISLAATGASAPTLVNSSYTIQPQSMIYSSANYIVADAAAPANPIGMVYVPTSVGPPPATGLYFTDGARVKIDGSATAGTAANAAATLTAIAYNDATSLNLANRFLYATDPSANAVVANNSAAAGNSGIYAFDPTTLVSTAVAVQTFPSNYISFTRPVGIVKGPDQKLYVADASNGKIYQLSLSGNSGAVATIGAFQLATVTGVSQSSVFAPVSATTSTFVGMTADAAPGKNIYIASPGDNTIKAIDTTTFGNGSNVTVSNFATGAAFVAVAADTAASAATPTLYATTTGGKIVTLPSTGGAAVDTGLATGATTDGFAGVLAPLGAVTAPAAPYLVQGQTGNFWNATAPAPLPVPYSITQGIFATLIPGAIFNNPATVSALPAVNALGDTLGVGGTAPAASSIKGGFGIVYIPTSVTATNNLTPGSFIFADGTGAGNVLRTLIP